MEKPTDPEKIQLIAVLHVLGSSLDTVASTLHLGKPTVMETEKWIRTGDYKTVWDIFDDKVIEVTVGRDLPSLESDPDILVRAGQVDRAAILLHYGRKVSEEDLEEKLRQHKNDLAECAKELVKRLKKYSEEWEGDLKIYEILVNEDDFGGIEFFNKKITQGLLIHLANYDEYFSELQELKTWDELSIGDINENFVNLISLRAALGEFSGKCKICEKLIPE
jgi:hypothetical protein